MVNKDEKSRLETKAFFDISYFEYIGK